MDYTHQPGLSQTLVYRSTKGDTANEVIAETLLAGTYYVRVEEQEEGENNYVFRYGRHSQIKGFLRSFRGIATKYLDSYLRWFHLVELGDQPSPRACLEAAMAKPCLRFAN